jgi:DNA topoisomerase I
VSAKKAGLKFVTDKTPGLSRHRSGAGFVYRDSSGRRVTQANTLARITSLAIPPAWTDVWICAHPQGHLQATGRDAGGRKQSRYHPDFRSARDDAKYGRLIRFARKLPQLRRTVRRHLKQPGLSRERVLASVVSLLEKTLIRVGNDSYAKTNDHYGLTTLHNGHVEVKGKTIRFRYVGKSGVKHEVSIDSPELARVVKACQDLPEQQLFEYVDDDGRRRDVKSDDVNDYLREATGEDFSAKDFRTWAGTVLASRALAEFKKFDSQTQAKKNILRAIETVAKRLGNTRAVCRKCYIHPTVFNTYLDGTLADVLREKAECELRQADRLSGEEAAVVALLRDQMRPRPKNRPRAG